LVGKKFLFPHPIEIGDRLKYFVYRGDINVVVSEASSKLFSPILKTQAFPFQ